MHFQCFTTLFPLSLHLHSPHAHRPLIRSVIGEGYQIAFFVLISSPSTLFCFCASYSVFVVVETTALHPSAKNTRDSIPPRLQLRLKNAAACPAQEFSVGGRSTKASFNSNNPIRRSGRGEDLKPKTARRRRHDHPHPVLLLREGDRQQVGGLPGAPAGGVHRGVSIVV